MAGLLCRIEYVLELLMEGHLDNSPFVSYLMYTQATLINTVYIQYFNLELVPSSVITNLCNIIEPFVSLTIKQGLSFGPKCMRIITIDRIKTTNSSTSSPRIEFFSVSRFNKIVSISSLIKIGATSGRICLSTSILNKNYYFNELQPEVKIETRS